jgi:cyclopropane-fatty-acyl-phospholipid synthase
MQSIYSAIVNRIHKRGTIAITWPNGRRQVFGDGGPPSAAIRLHGAMTPLKIATNPVLGLGEAYMDGALTLEDGTHIAQFLKVACTNLEWSPDNPNFGWAQTGRRLGSAFGQLNRLKRARRNVAHHYDLTDELFDIFLDPNRQYSCAYFARPGMSLDEAQGAKLDMITRKLILDRPGLNVLDIGCGWGGLAVHLARTASASVHGVTLSDNQAGHARERVAAAGLADKVEIELTDYRDVGRRYHRIASIGMFEHVGRPNYRAYFQKIYELLEDDGVVVMQTCGRADGPGDTDPWMGKYIFPGGYAPALSEIMPHIERAGFYVTDIEIWRGHYVHTLTHWYERCMAARDRIVALHDERFFRMWMFYLAAARMAFEHLGHVLFQIQLQKKVIGAVPNTRDYLYCGRESAVPGGERPAPAG